MKRIVSTWHVYVLTLSVAVFWSVSMVFALVRTFGLNQVLSLTETWVLAGSVFLGLALGSVLYCWLRYHALRYLVMPHYRAEFAAIFLFSGLGIMGTVIIAQTLGLPNRYMMHLMLFLFMINYIFLAEVGKAFYHVSLFNIR